MMKPFQKDIDFLKEELVHHEYIAKKYAQEIGRNSPQYHEFNILCEQIRNAIEAVENRQNAAIAEWSAISPSKRHTILLPLVDALEKVVKDMKANGCPEFGIYLDEYLTYYLIDLQNFAE